MALLTKDVTYAAISRLTDWYLHAEALRVALADLVNAIAALDTTQVWGDGRASRSDGQCFLVPRRVRRRPPPHPLGGYAVEVYPLIAHHDAPVSCVPLACTELGAPYVP